jgi:hypothetical protein
MDDETVEMREDVPGMMRGSGVGDRGSVLDNTSKVIFPTGRFNANSHTWFVLQSFSLGCATRACWSFLSAATSGSALFHFDMHRCIFLIDVLLDGCNMPPSQFFDTCG